MSEFFKIWPLGGNLAIVGSGLVVREIFATSHHYACVLLVVHVVRREAVKQCLHAVHRDLAIFNTAMHRSISSIVS